MASIVRERMYTTSEVEMRTKTDIWSSRVVLKMFSTLPETKFSINFFPIKITEHRSSRKTSLIEMSILLEKKRKCTVVTLQNLPFSSQNVFFYNYDISFIFYLRKTSKQTN